MTPEIFVALSPLGERVACVGAFFSRTGTRAMLVEIGAVAVS